MLANFTNEPQGFFFSEDNSAPAVYGEDELCHKDMTLLVDGRQAFHEILRCMDAARKSVVINMFVWRDDVIGNIVAEAVLRAADRGVKVTISVDRYAVVLERSEECKKSFFHRNMTCIEWLKTWALERIYPAPGTPRREKDTGGERYRRICAHPNITLDHQRFKADHSKYYIFDGEILILGGINIEDKENGCDMQGREYGDYMAKLCGQKYVKAFLAKLEGKEEPLCGIYFGMNIKKPEPRRFEMEQMYLDMINDAARELVIVMSYFSPLPRFMEAILKAYERGVRVTILLPESSNFQNDSNRKAAKKLLRASQGGIAVYFSPRMLHTKMMISEKQITFGSTNITKKAFHQLSELNLFVENRPSAFCRAVKEDVVRNVERAHRVHAPQEIKYGALKAFFEGFLV